MYGAPARWILPKDQEAAALNGATIVTPPEILATHLLEIIKQNFSRLLTLKSLRRLLSEMTRLSDTTRAEANRKLLDELIPDKVPIDTLHAVLRLLLDEKVSIRNMALILEAVAEARLTTTQPEGICELVRQRLGFQLVADMKRDDGSIPLIQLAPEWEDTFATYQIDAPNAGLDVALPPQSVQQAGGWCDLHGGAICRSRSVSCRCDLDPAAQVAAHNHARSWGCRTRFCPSRKSG